MSNAITKLGRSLLRAMFSAIYIREPMRVLTTRNLLPRALWTRLPVETTFQVRLPDGRSFMYAPIVGDAIGRSLYWRGIRFWEAETVSVFYTLARKSRIVLDIGANTGAFTLLACAATEQSRIIAFEPVSDIRALLMNNVSINGWNTRCSIRHEAVSNSTGTAKIHIPVCDFVPTTARLSEQGFVRSASTSIDVPMITIDSLLSSSDAQLVDLVKIDVEGCEDRVLEGMTNILTTSKPAIIVECNADGPCAAVEHILKNFHYTFFHLTDKGKIPMSSIVPDKTGVYRNFLCVAQGSRCG